MNGMKHVLDSLKLGSIDTFITPAAFSSFLAYIYDKVTRAPVSSSQRKVEDFMATCFTPKTDPSEMLLCDAFFEGAILTSDGDKSALTAVLNVAPYKRSIESRRICVEKNHTRVPRFARSHIYSPPVSHCGICGEAFLSSKEMKTLIALKDRGRKAFKEAVVAAVERMKQRRCEHFASVFGTSMDSIVPTATSSSCSLHESVRAVCSTPRYIKLNNVTRELVLAVLNDILSRSEPGFPYYREFLENIVICANDFLLQRSRLTESERLALARPNIISIADRLALEVEADDLRGVDIADADSFDPEVLRQLTLPIPFDVAAESVVSKKSD